MVAVQYGDGDDETTKDTTWIRDAGDAGDDGHGDCGCNSTAATATATTTTTTDSKVVVIITTNTMPNECTEDHELNHNGAQSIN